MDRFPIEFNYLRSDRLKNNTARMMNIILVVHIFNVGKSLTINFQTQSPKLSMLLRMIIMLCENLVSSRNPKLLRDENQFSHNYNQSQSTPSFF